MKIINQWVVICFERTLLLVETECCKYYIANGQGTSFRPITPTEANTLIENS